MVKSVVYATDDNYWIPLYVSIYSLLYNNPKDKFDIFIMCKDQDDEFTQNISTLKTIHDDFTIHYVEIDREFNSVPKPRYFTEGIYYRLLIDELLPESLDNVLYIDCDTIINGSVSDIFNINMESKIVAGAPEFHDKLEFLGIKSSKSYYNTGVLLINLNEWRSNKISKKSFDLMENKNDTSLPIQYVLNEIINDNDWYRIEPVYNLELGWANHHYITNLDFNPIVIHYTGASKPWDFDCVHPFKQLWWVYLEETPYSELSPQGKGVKGYFTKTKGAFELKMSKTLYPYPRIYDICSKAYNKLTP